MITVKRYIVDKDRSAKEMLIESIEGALKKAGDANISITISNSLAWELLEELGGAKNAK